MTAAPTLIVSDIATGVGDTDVSLAGVAVGDLVVIIVNDQESSVALTTTVGGVSKTPTWAADNTVDDGTRRSYIESTIAVDAGTWVVSASPFSAGNTRRIIGMVFRPAAGDSWSSGRLHSTMSQTSTAGGASQAVGSWSDPTKPCVAVGTLYSPSTSNGTANTYKWDGTSTATAPLYNAASIMADSADYQLYADSGGTRPSGLTITNGMNLGHAANGVLYKTQGGASGESKSVARGVCRGVTAGVAG